MRACSCSRMGHLDGCDECHAAQHVVFASYSTFTSLKNNRVARGVRVGVGGKIGHVGGVFCWAVVEEERFFLNGRTTPVSRVTLKNGSNGPIVK